MSDLKDYSADELYFDLGSYRRSVTTKVKPAQTWFNRGLIWSYAFNHEEAAVCFSQAISHDTGLAMAYWGLAYTLGPNYKYILLGICNQRSANNALSASHGNFSIKTSLKSLQKRLIALQQKR